jgi:hypothetical protein
MTSPPTVVLQKAFDYKYSGADWRLDIVETFRRTKEVRTRYTTSDGQLLGTVETTKEYASGLAQVSTDPINGPPFTYGDGSFHADPAEIFQTTHVKTTTYEDYSATSCLVTIDDFDVLKNKHTITKQVIDGKIPLAPTKKSALTSLILQPLVGKLLYNCAWVPNTVPLDLPYAENENEMGRAARRQQQRDTAIVRSITLPMNPRIRVGQTVRLIDKGRSIDAMHVVVAIKHIQNSQTGEARAELTLEFWNRMP